MHEEKWTQIIFNIFMTIKHIFSQNVPNTILQKLNILNVYI